MAFAAAPAPADAPASPVAKPETVGMSAERLGRIGPAMQRYIDSGLVPGTVTLVARKGKIVHLEARGARDAESGAPMSTDVIFRIASMTKPITSVALMMLYEEGKFRLNDPISKWMPEYAEPKVAEPLPDSAAGPRYRLVPAVRPITVRQLLTHTAGLANSYLGFFKEEVDKVSAKQKPDDTVADYVTRLAAVPLNYQPGERWEYSGATNHVGRLVEILSGMTLDEFFQKRIFEPLGMKDTHFYLPASKLPRFAAQYTPGEKDKKIVLGDAPTAESRFVKEPHTFFMGAGGLVSTATDYWRFQQMMLQGGELDGRRILGRKTVELMTVESHRRSTDLAVRPRVRVRPRLQRAARPRRRRLDAVGRHLRLGRRLLHLLLGRSARRDDRDPDDPGPALRPPRHSRGVLGPGQPGHLRLSTPPPRTPTRGITYPSPRRFGEVREAAACEAAGKTPNQTWLEYRKAIQRDGCERQVNVSPGAPRSRP